MIEQIKNLVVEEEGQGMAEYGLILAGVAVVAIAAFTALGGGIKGMINGIVTDLKGTPAP